MATWGQNGVQGGESIKQIDLADIFNRAETIRNNRIQNRLAQMQMENENARRGIMKNAAIPAAAALPQQGTPAQPAFDPNMGRSYSGQPTQNALALTRPEALGGSMSPIDPSMANALAPASPDYHPAQEARPAGFNYDQAQNQLLGQGMVQEAAQMRQLKTADIPIMAEIGDIAQKNGVAAGAAVWKQAGFDQKYGDFNKFFTDGQKHLATTEWGTRNAAASGDVGSQKALSAYQAEKQAGQGDKNPTEASLAVMAAGADPVKAEQARKALAMLQGEKESRPAPTLNTDKGLMQWNPKTQAYDIYAGKGAEAAKEERANKREVLRDSQAVAKADIVIGKVDEALKQVGFFTTGLTGNTLSRISGTSATDLENTIETIKGNLGFDALSNMRAASPTGGALGNVSNIELSLLTSAVSSLKIGQSRDQLEKNLKEVKQHYEGWKKTLTQSQADNGGGEKPSKLGVTSSGGRFTIKSKIGGK